MFIILLNRLLLIVKECNQFRHKRSLIIKLAHYYDMRPALGLADQVTTMIVTTLANMVGKHHTERHTVLSRPQETEFIK